MTIAYFGLTSFRLQTKKIDGVSVVINPLSDKSGIKVSKINADILLLSSPKSTLVDAKKVNQDTFLIDAPGEYDVKNVSVSGIAVNTKEAKNTIYKINIDNISVTHLGELKQKLDSKTIEKLNGTDILITPIGGKGEIDTRAVMEIINLIEPRIIIPMNYSLPGITEKLNSLEDFIQESGLKPTKEEKLKIAQKDLPQDESELIVLGVG